VIGYERATEIAAEALKTGKGVIELVKERKLLSDERIRKVLDPVALTRPNR